MHHMVPWWNLGLVAESMMGGRGPCTTRDKLHDKVQMTWILERSMQPGKEWTFSVCTEFMVTTGKSSGLREECDWSHACSLQASSVGSNSILECRIPFKTEHRAVAIGTERKDPSLSHSSTDIIPLNDVSLLQRPSVLCDVISVVAELMVSRQAVLHQPPFTVV